MVESLEGGVRVQGLGVGAPGPTPYTPTPDLNCPGSGQPPRIEGGKPHCKVCGKGFKWQQMEDQVRYVPEHP